MDANPRAVLGGNSPPLGERLALDHAELVKRAQEAIAGVPVDLAAIQSEQEAEDYTDQAGDIKDLIAEADAAFEPEKKPWRDAAKTVDDFFAFRSDLKAAVARLVAKLNAHATAKRDAQRQVELAEQERARKEAIAFEEPVPMVVVAPVKDVARVVTPFGRKASAGTKWDWELVDITKVPAHYLIVNKAMVDAAVKTGTRSIDGLKIFDTVTTSIRR